MKKNNKFLIVNRPVDPDTLENETGRSLTKIVKNEWKKIANSVMEVPSVLLKSVSMGGAGLEMFVGNILPDALIVLAKRKFFSSSVAKVGLIDLGAWVSHMPELLRIMNASQNKVDFFELQTSVPAGLIKTKGPMIEWASSLLDRKLSLKEATDLQRNMLADEFNYFAEAVRVKNELDRVVGLTSAMIAFSDADQPRWNYYAAGGEYVSVVSTCDLRAFSSSAGKPFEAAVGMLIAAQVFGGRNNMDYHKESRSCIFDFNRVRAEMVNSLSAMRLCDECAELIEDPAELQALNQLLLALSNMKEN